MTSETARRATPFLDAVGEMFDRMGIHEPFGRVAGWLMIAEPACQTPHEIAEALGNKPDEIMLVLDGLSAMGSVERISRPGTSEACYALRSLNEILNTRLQQLHDLRALSEDGLRLAGELPGTDPARLQEFHDFYAFYERELPGLFQRWQAERSAKARR